MEQVNAFAFYSLGRVLDAIFLGIRLPMKMTVYSWQSAASILDSMIAPGPAKKHAFHLNESGGHAVDLRVKISQALNWYESHPDEILPDQLIGEFNASFGRFDQALALDLGRSPIFYVSQKGIFSTTALINYAEAALVDEVRASVSEQARRDLNQSGRCLAFGLPTASGYHSLRAVEQVLREYYVRATGNNTLTQGAKTTPVAEANMSPLINEMRHLQKGEPKTLQVLDQIRDLHRNPINHPDIFLEPAEALELFNICSGAISAMARQIITLPAASTATPPGAAKQPGG